MAALLNGEIQQSTPSCPHCGESPLSVSMFPETSGPKWRDHGRRLVGRWGSDGNFEKPCSRLEGQGERNPLCGNSQRRQQWTRRISGLRWHVLKQDLNMAISSLQISRFAAEGYFIAHSIYLIGSWLLMCFPIIMLTQMYEIWWKMSN